MGERLTEHATSTREQMATQESLTGELFARFEEFNSTNRRSGSPSDGHAATNHLILQEATGVHETENGARGSGGEETAAMKPLSSGMTKLPARECPDLRTPGESASVLHSAGQPDEALSQRAARTTQLSQQPSSGQPRAGRSSVSTGRGDRHSQVSSGRTPAASQLG